MAREHLRAKNAVGAHAEVRRSNAPSKHATRTVEMAAALQIRRCAKGCHAVVESCTLPYDSLVYCWTFIPGSMRLPTGSGAATHRLHRLRGAESYLVPRGWVVVELRNVYPDVPCWLKLLLELRARDARLEAMERRPRSSERGARSP